MVEGELLQFGVAVFLSFRSPLFVFAFLFISRFFCLFYLSQIFSPSGGAPLPPPPHAATLVLCHVIQCCASSYKVFCALQLFLCCVSNCVVFFTLYQSMFCFECVSRPSVCPCVGLPFLGRSWVQQQVANGLLTEEDIRIK